MKKIIIGVAIILVVLLIIASTLVLNKYDEYYNTEDLNIGHGSAWAQTIAVTYTDGTTETVSGEGLQPLTWFQGDKQVEWVEYRLYACVKTYDTHVSTVDFDFSNFWVTFSCNAPDTAIWNKQPERMLATLPMPVLQQTSPPTDAKSNEFVFIGVAAFYPFEPNVEDVFPDEPGTYTFTFQPSGIESDVIKYKTDMMSTWETINGPTNPLSFQLEKKDDLFFYWNPSPYVWT